MNPRAKRHHYLPQFYLARFTSNGTDSGLIHVLDKKQSKLFPTTPLNVGVESNFNQINYNGEPSDILEQKLSSVEGSIAPAVKSVIEGQHYLSSDRLMPILNLVASIQTHNPRARKKNSEYWETRFRKFGDRILEAREGRVSWDGLSLDSGETITNRDVEIFAGITDHQLASGKYRLEFSMNAVIREEFDDMDQLLSLLWERNWTILLAPKDQPGFICCDDPVRLIGANSNISVSDFRSREKEVFFPLSTHVGILGVYGVPKASVQDADLEFVGEMNFGLLRKASRFVYFREANATIKYGGEVKTVPIT